MKLFTMEIERIIIFSSGIENQYQFYCNQLMLECVEKNEDFFCVKIGSSLLQIQKGARHISTCYHLAFNIEPSLFLESATFLQHKNISLLNNENKILIDFPDWNARSIYFKDADGNILECIARFNLPHQSFNRLFGAGDFLCISEIGIPVNDISEFLLSVQSKTSIEIWKSYGQWFCAAGDEKGLLIIVPEKHKWFPTNIEAVQLPAQICIHQEGENFTYGNLAFVFTANDH